MLAQSTKAYIIVVVVVVLVLVMIIFIIIILIPLHYSNSPQSRIIYDGLQADCTTDFLGDTSPAGVIIIYFDHCEAINTGMHL